MNTVLWVLQILLALHTLMGAIWKFSNPPEQTMPSLTAIPDGLWRALGAVEIPVAAGFVLPFVDGLGVLAPVAAAFIVAEMLAYCGIHARSGSKEAGPVVYWLVVAALAGFVAYGRFVLVPI